MNDLTKLISDCYSPFKAILFYRDANDSFYLESYDIDNNGMAINAHPLSLKESAEIADALGNSRELKNGYLNGASLLPRNILHMDKDGGVVWHTSSKKVNLFFHADLGISDGMTYVPPMIWKADKNLLHVWAVRNNKRPCEETLLYHAPFFNVYDMGNVCMGTVRKQIPSDCSLEQFMSLWEKFFFNSTFTHTIRNGTVSGEELGKFWKRQIQSVEKFPVAKLKKCGLKLREVLC